MLKFAKAVVRKRKLILIIGLLLLIPSAIGFVKTHVNYDVLVYLPNTMDTVKGQDILLDEFDKGGFAMVMVDGMDKKDVAKMKSRFEQVDHVESVIWYDTIMDLSTPEEILPESIRDVYEDGDTTLMAVFFNTPTSDEGSIEAVQKLRQIGGEQCFVSGMSAFVTDLKELAEEQEPIYVAIAVILALLAMTLFMDSFVVPLVFMAGIGITILYNMGSNLFLGDVSYITKAIAAVLQLAVTMDYSIFLWHSYKEHRLEKGMGREEAMANAISKTLVSVAGSSITTIAGFLALCFMTFTLGLNLGLVMAKGVLLGVIGSVTILPALILALEKPIMKTQHKPFIPVRFNKFYNRTKITTKPWIWAIIFVVLLVPALYGYTHTDTYYKLDEGVPDNLPFKAANEKLEKDFNISTNHMILISSDVEQKEVGELIDKINKIDGVESTLGLETALGSAVPEEMLPTELESVVKSEHYQLLIVNSKYEVASDEVNQQVEEINRAVKEYDEDGLLIGEAACTKDLIDITNHDFKVVTAVSVGAIFLIILLVLQSLSLPFILLGCIELAIFINLGIPFFTGTVMSFIDSICISTIQLGATVDYAILMTNRYKRERNGGLDAREAVRVAHSRAMPSVIISALGFFAATIGVSIYSDIDIISSMTFFMARGALVSTLIVMFMLPALLVLFDRVIIKTSKGFENVEGAFHYKSPQKEERSNA